MLQLPGYGDHLAATVNLQIHDHQEMAPKGFADVTAMLIEVAADERARWHVSFGVADRDAAAATAEHLGATIVSTSEDMWTRQALVRDPQGAEFSISQFTSPDDW